MDKKQIFANEPSGEGLVKGILHLEARMNKGQGRGEGENQEKTWICNLLVISVSSDQLLFLIRYVS